MKIFLPLLVTAAIVVLTQTASSVPVITGFTPSSKAPGANVLITGSDFSATPEVNIVRFGAVRAAVLTANSTQLLVAVPLGATYAPITVTVDGLTAYSTAPFEPTFNGNGAPVDTATFAPGVNLTSANPITTVIADLDGDGKPDLIVANTYSNSISIHQNIGTVGILDASTFAAPVVLPVGTGAYATTGITAADLDGDGRLDLVSSDRNTGRVAIYRNISAGGVLTAASFESPVFFTAGVDTRRVCVRDLDGDGRPDIICANYGGPVSILPNVTEARSITTNSFAAPVYLALAGLTESLAVGDLDGDGLPDLAVADHTGYLSLFRNNCTPGNISTGTFDARVDLPAQNNSIGVVIGDLDNDGKPELAVTAFVTSTMSVYRNLSTPGALTTGSFAAPVDYHLPGWGHMIALGDINGDGKPDVTEVTELNSRLLVFQNVGTGDFTEASLAAPVEFATGWNAWALAVGDLDGDGQPDVVFGNQYDNTLTLYKNVIPAAAPVNAAPVADASATQTKIITCRETEVAVVLNGSQSYDPDGDPLLYLWYDNGSTSPLAEGVTAPVVLPHGTSSITLLVSDGLASDDQTITIRVMTTAEAVEDLMAWVNAEAPRPRPLLATLGAALRSIRHNHSIAAIGQLRAFQFQVRAQLCRHDPALARALTGAAQDIINVELLCRPGNKWDRDCR